MVSKRGIIGYMSKRVVVITGGGSGMGLAAALKFAANGDKVYILGRSEDKLKEASKLSEHIDYLVADVTNISQLQKARQELLKAEKGIDVLVNSAGGRGSKKPSEKPSPEELAEVWDEVVKLNLSSVYYVIQTFVDLIRNSGRIINISSLAAHTGSSQGGVIGTSYAAAKSGIHGIDRTLAKELGVKKITINSIAPGLVQSTDFFGKEGIPDRVKDRYNDSILMGRIGEPEDIAAGVFYLASEEADWITGEIF